MFAEERNKTRDSLTISRVIGYKCRTEDMGGAKRKVLLSSVIDIGPKIWVSKTRKFLDHRMFNTGPKLWVQNTGDKRVRE